VDRESAFEAWAPRGGIWTPWAKAVLFAYMDETTALAPPPAAWLHRGLFDGATDVQGYRASGRARGQAIVVDLAGVEGVAVGLALAELGLRPVPLYAAVPSERAFVPMGEVVQALLHGAQELPRKGLPLEAPPAFLLDARRDSGESPLRGHYDNRSVVFPTDFPSAERLQRAGITEIVLIQAGGGRAREDVSPILASWQAAGLPIRCLPANSAVPAASMHVRRPGLLRRAARWLGGAPTPDHGGRFGRWIPESPQGG
jgi:hypothetical protein